MGEVSEYLRILYKINEVYSKTKLDYDLLNEIDFYQKSKLKKNEIKDLENKCLEEWKTLILKLIEILESKTSKKKYKELLISELKDVSKIKTKISNKSFNLVEFENIFDNELEKIKDNIETKLNKEKQNNKKFWLGITLGFILGVIASLIANKIW